MSVHKLARYTYASHIPSIFVIFLARPSLHSRTHLLPSSCRYLSFRALAYVTFFHHAWGIGGRSLLSTSAAAMPPRIGPPYCVYYDFLGLPLTVVSTRGPQLHTRRFFSGAAPSGWLWLRSRACARVGSCSLNGSVRAPDASVR